MASLPASNAVIRRCVCSSNSSRLLSNHSPARPCASVAISCARRATSLLRSASSSRVSRPVFGAMRSAAAAPSMPPRKNQPRYPAASFLSLAMVISLLRGHPLQEHVEPPLQPGRQPAQLPGAGETRQPGCHPRDAVGGGIHALRHFADALDLLTRLTRQQANVFRERMGLADQRPQFLLGD